MECATGREKKMRKAGEKAHQHLSLSLAGARSRESIRFAASLTHPLTSSFRFPMHPCVRISCARLRLPSRLVLALVLRRSTVRGRGTEKKVNVRFSLIRHPFLSSPSSLPSLHPLSAALPLSLSHTHSHSLAVCLCTALFPLPPSPLLT